MTLIHAYAPAPMAIFSRVDLSSALMAAGVLVSDYYIQFSAIPMGLANRSGSRRSGSA